MEGGSFGAGRWDLPQWCWLLLAVVEDGVPGLQTGAGYQAKVVPLGLGVG